MPEMPKRDGPRDAKANPKGGTKEGEEMTREDVVQAALKVERWCEEHEDEYGKCDCPFSTPLEMSKTNPAIQWGKCIFTRGVASDWGLETFLRKRGLNHDD